MQETSSKFILVLCFVILFILVMFAGCIISKSPADKLAEIEEKYLKNYQLAPENLSDIQALKVELQNLEKKVNNTKLADYIKARLLVLEAKEHIINANTEMKKFRQMDIKCEEVDFKFISDEIGKAKANLESAAELLRGYKQYSEFCNNINSLKEALFLLIENIKDTKMKLCK
ncbi:MAG: hypothetical protein J7L14_00850 [Candidatus Diapherotrites archaeon]|nr:hypothetical protein [Candidatus Diapherotrites archaeon]